MLLHSINFMTSSISVLSISLISLSMILICLKHIHRDISPSSEIDIILYLDYILLFIIIIKIFTYSYEIATH